MEPEVGAPEEGKLRFRNVYSEVHQNGRCEFRTGIVEYGVVALAKASADRYSPGGKWLGVINTKTGEFYPAQPKDPTPPSQEPRPPHNGPQPYFDLRNFKEVENLKREFENLRICLDELTRSREENEAHPYLKISESNWWYITRTDSRLELERYLVTQRRKVIMELQRLGVVVSEIKGDEENASSDD